MFEIGNQLLSGSRFRDINWRKVGVATLAGGITATMEVLFAAGVNGVANVILDAMDGKRGVQLCSSFVVSAGTSLIGSAAQKIVGKIATNIFKDTSKTNIKKIVTQVCDINGSERNICKTVSNWDKDITQSINKYFEMKPVAFFSGQGVFSILNLIGNRIKNAYGW